MLSKSAKYHHNCHIRYSPYNLARKKKSLRSKNKKAEVAQSSAILRWYLLAQILVHLQVQQFQILFALHAVNMMLLRKKVHAAGAFHASKSKLNSEHVIKLTNNWRGTGVYIGDNALVNSLLVLTAHFTTKVVQLTYTINLPKSRRM